MSENQELVEALERFDALLKRPRTKEAEWQRLFADCPYILSRSLPLRIEPRQIQALGRPGRSEPDFVIHPEPTRYGSPRGIIELKPPQSHVLTFPRKDQVILTRAAATAVQQVHHYANQALWPDRVVVLGNDLYLFVIMGIAKEWADKIQDQIFRQQLVAQLGQIHLFGYDQIFTNFYHSCPRPVILLVPVIDNEAARQENKLVEEEPDVWLPGTCEVCGGELKLPNGAWRYNSHYCSGKCAHSDDVAM